MEVTIANAEKVIFEIVFILFCFHLNRKLVDVLICSPVRLLRFEEETSIDIKDFVIDVHSFILQIAVREVPV